jgi:integrase
LLSSVTPPLHYSDYHRGQGPAFHEQACKLSLEGIASKRADAPYASGNRGLITEQTRAAVGEWLAGLGDGKGRYLFPSRFRERPHLSTRQYARIVHRWVECAGLNGSAYGTHSLRRTKPAQIYKKTGNLRAVQLLLGHTKLESTVRYLGIELDDALSISEQIEL